MVVPVAAVDEQGMPFAGRTGHGVRVAVIDSGVNQQHPHISMFEGGVCIDEHGIVQDGDYTDYLGHGTAVTAAIQEKAPGAQYFAARLFRNSLRATAEGLLNAIDWAITQHMDVVNLSLGTRNPIHVSRCTAAIERASEHGVLIVAAREADGELCYPGSLPGVISVGLDWACPRERYRVEMSEGPVFFASGYPRSLPGVTRERNLNGISFAVANMCGIVIRACEAVADDAPGSRHSPETVCKVLVAEALTFPAR